MAVRATEVKKLEHLNAGGEKRNEKERRVVGEEERK